MKARHDLFYRRILLLATVCLVVFFLAAGYSHAASRATLTEGWKVGYWFWNADGDPEMLPPGEKPLELLYAQVGEYRQDTFGGRIENISMNWPDKLPDAVATVAVFRFDGTDRPGADMVPQLIEQYRRLKDEADKTGRVLIGLQLDYDCPYGKLKAYARFLKKLRAAFPKEDSISITALLDWFRPGTAVADVIRNVDEFVPQFYDLSPDVAATEASGAAQAVDPLRWAKIFNSYGRPYRIGAASFGRIVEIVGGGKSSASRKKKSSREVRIIDNSPLELMAKNRLTPLSAKTSEAGETILRFRIKYTDSCCSSSAVIHMIIPTQRSVASAFSGAKAMGGWCRGVVFFRWPLANEAMALGRREVEAAISGKENPDGDSHIEAEDGLCAAVSCRDLYLRLKDRFPRAPLSFRVRTSGKLEYFLPFSLVKTRVAGERLLEVSVPADAGVPRIYLGRAVSLDPVDFTLEEARK